MSDKARIRKQLRQARREHARALPENVRALILHRPPTQLLDLIPLGTMIGLYREDPDEAPATSYAKFFFDRGHELALPRFANRESPMEFARFADPYGESDLELGTFDLWQPVAEAPTVVPDILIAPLVGFTEHGARLGQGGGHYDRWLADHPGTVAIGLAWDCQKVEELPLEPHDQPLAAIVTPTRFYGPFA